MFFFMAELWPVGKHPLCPVHCRCFPGNCFCPFNSRFFLDGNPITAPTAHPESSSSCLSNVSYFKAETDHLTCWVFFLTGYTHCFLTSWWFNIVWLFFSIFSPCCCYFCHMLKWMHPRAEFELLHEDFKLVLLFSLLVLTKGLFS